MDGYRRNHRNTPKTSRNIQIHRIKNIAATLRRRDRKKISSDVLGSYTGTSSRGESPEQDADDL